MPETSRIDELRRRVDRDPASIAFAALAEEYRRAGLPEEAIETCLSGLKRHPAYVSARVVLGRALLDVGRYDEARTELEQVLRIAPENLAAIRALADIHHRTGEVPPPVPDPRGATRPHDGPPAAAPPVRGVPLSRADDSSHPPDTHSAAADGPVVSVDRVRRDPTPLPEPAAPTPLRLVSTLAPVHESGVEESPVPLMAPGPAAPVAVASPAHPDTLALPALEAFLAAIVRTRAERSPEQTQARSL
jgi:tetratricopeptide (TPR) repeat protein